MFRCPLLSPSPPSHVLCLTLAHLFFNLSPSPSPDRPSYQCPFPSVWFVPFPFHSDDPAAAPFLLSVWLSYTQMPPQPLPTPCHPHSYLTSSCMSASPSLYLCPLLSIPNIVSCSLSPNALSSSGAPAAQMPGLVCNSCLAMCHYQVLPSMAGASCVCVWGGGGCVY